MMKGQVPPPDPMSEQSWGEGQGEMIQTTAREEDEDEIWRPRVSLARFRFFLPIFSLISVTDRELQADLVRPSSLWVDMALEIFFEEFDAEDDGLMTKIVNLFLNSIQFAKLFSTITPAERVYFVAQKRQEYERNMRRTSWNGQVMVEADSNIGM